MFGGGDSGADAASGAASTQASYAAQAQAAQAAQLQKALDLQQQQYNIGRGDLNQYYNQAQSTLSPYSLGGYNAYDTYEGTLGLATPTGGSFSLAQTLNQGSKIQDQINNFKVGSGLDRSKLNSLIASRAAPGMQPWGSGNVGVDLSSLPDENVYNLINQWVGDANRMISSGSTIDGTPVQFRRDQAQRLQDWVNQVNAAGLQSPDQAAAQKATQQAELDKLKQDPNYLKYQDYQNGKVDMSTEAPGGALSKFFNTPGYQLQFGNSGAAVDPNASPLDRFQSSPGYQFQLNQGTSALEKSMASRGLLESGSFAKELDNYSQGLANQDWNNYLNRVTGTFSNYQNQLSGLAGMGAQTSGVLSNMAIGQGSNLATLGANYANSASNIYGAMGTGAANSLLAQGGALAGGMINGYNLNAANNQANSQLGSFGLSQLGGMLNSKNGGQGTSVGGLNLGGAASGASAGSAFGPWGAVAGGVLGAIF